jgi:hypothetical protein
MRFIISNFVIDVKEKRKSQSGGAGTSRRYPLLKGKIIG